MKKMIFSLCWFLLSPIYVFGQVGINTENIHESAVLELYSDSKGLLITRVQLKGIKDIQTIPSPATGLLVYNTKDCYLLVDNIGIIKV